MALFLSGMYLPAPPVMGALGAEVKCTVSRTRAINSRGQRDGSVVWADGQANRPGVVAKSGLVCHTDPETAVVPEGQDVCL